MAWGKICRFVFWVLSQSPDLKAETETLWHDLKTAVHQHPLSKISSKEQKTYQNLCVQSSKRHI